MVRTGIIGRPAALACTFQVRLCICIVSWRLLNLIVALLLECFIELLLVSDNEPGHRSQRMGEWYEGMNETAHSSLYV